MIDYKDSGSYMGMVEGQRRPEPPARRQTDDILIIWREVQ